ncbi:phage tail assembly protein [Pseudomonas sp. Marseille-Q8238]
MGSIIDNAHDQQQDATREAAAKPLATATPAPPQNPNQATVTLDEPIVRANQTISELTLRKPMSGELRGVALVDLLNLEVNALRKVLPRITTPLITDVEVGRLDPADLVELGSTVAGFLVRKSVKAEAFLTA